MLREVFFSVVNVISNALDFSEEYHSKIIEIRLPDGTPFSKVIVVIISIILTPGTTIVQADGLNLKIHCLTKEAYQSMHEKAFIKKILSYNF